MCMACRKNYIEQTPSGRQEVSFVCILVRLVVKHFTEAFVLDSKVI